MMGRSGDGVMGRRSSLTKTLVYIIKVRELRVIVNDPG